MIAFDTDHIKRYVFGADILKEIRGASSLLDRLNRDVMVKLAERPYYGGTVIYANGGSGLFLIDSAKAEAFGAEVQQEYRQLTAGGASVTYVVQELPKDAPGTVEKIMNYSMPYTLTLVHHRLQERKGHPHIHTDAVSHPLMRLCDSCGIFYAVEFASREQEFYCQSCLNKRKEDEEVSTRILGRAKARVQFSICHFSLVG